MKFLFALGCLCAALAFASCGGGGGGDDSTGDGAVATESSVSGGSSEAAGSATTTSEVDSAEGDKPPKLTVPKVPPSKFAYQDAKKGTGPGAKKGDEVTIQYLGIDYKTGKEFSSSWAGDEPLTFELGAGKQIQGWEQGLVGMKAGGRRELVVPAALAYGAKGRQGVPPGETVVFAVDLLAIE